MEKIHHFEVNSNASEHTPQDSSNLIKVYEATPAIINGVPFTMDAVNKEGDQYTTTMDVRGEEFVDIYLNDTVQLDPKTKVIVRDLVPTTSESKGYVLFELIKEE